MDVVAQLNPVYYRYNGKGETSDDGTEYIGIVAQDIMDVAPYTVGTHMAKLEEDDEEETELYTFNDSALTYILVNAINEQQAKIEQLEAEIDGLKAMVE